MPKVWHNMLLLGGAVALALGYGQFRERHSSKGIVAREQGEDRKPPVGMTALPLELPPKVVDVSQHGADNSSMNNSNTRNIVIVPDLTCEEGYAFDANGKCREIW